MALDHILLGVDYGTSSIKVFSTMVINGKSDGVPEIVLIQGARTTPSAVAFYKNKFYWGRDLVRDVENGNLPSVQVIKCAKLSLYDDYATSESSTLADRVRKQLKHEKKTIKILLRLHLRNIVQEATHFLRSRSTYLALFCKQIQDGVEIHAKISVPQLWSPVARKIMQEAAASTGLVTHVLVSEPICALAAHAARVERVLVDKGINTSVGGKFVVVDTGCGTVDIAMFQQLTAFGSKAKFKAIRQSAGSIGGSQQVNEILRKDVLGDINKDADKWPGGVKAVAGDLHISEPRFEHRLDDEIERVKILYSSSQSAFFMMHVHDDHGKSVFSYKITRLVFFRLDGTVIRCLMWLRERIFKALDKIVGAIVNQVTEMLKKGDSVQFMLLSGGFSGCKHLEDRLAAAFPSMNVILLGNAIECVKKMLVMYPVLDMLTFTRPSQVAEGAVSPRYDAIDARDLPAGVSYAVIRDEPWDPELHTDCLLPGSASEKDPKKVAGYLDHDREPMVLSRLKVFLPEGEVGGGKIEVPEWRYFGPEKGLKKEAVISCDFVYFRGNKFEDHDGALAADHEIHRSDNKYREGIHFWKTVEAKLVRLTLHYNLEQHLTDVRLGPRATTAAQIQVQIVSR